MFNKFKLYLESTLKQPNTVVLVGRFSPPGPHHIKIINYLKQKFKNDSFYILTSDPKKLDENNPYTFKQKKEIFNILGITKKDIKQLKGNGYNIEHIKKSIGISENSNITLIIGIGKKDFDSDEKTSLLKSDYFIKYTDSKLKKFKNKAYIYEIPNEEDKKTIANSSKIRKYINNNNEKSLISIYGKDKWEKIKQIIK